MTKRVVVTDHAFRNVDEERALAAEHGASFDVFSCTSEAETAQAVSRADVVLVNFAPITRTVMEQMRPGATVVRYGIGYDNVDVTAASEVGVQVANVPDYGVETVADHAAASLLSLARRLPEYDRQVHEHGWVRPSGIGPVRGFRSMVVGLVGMGRVAREVHRRLVPFGFSFVGYDPFAPADAFEATGVEAVTLSELAVRSHAVTLHAPATTETRHIIDEQFFAKAQAGLIVVNTARGALIDENALLDAVARGTVIAAALDVTEEEPVPGDSPLRDYPQITLTPHAAFYDEDSLMALQRLAGEEAGRALRAEPLRCQVA